MTCFTGPTQGVRGVWDFMLVSRGGSWGGNEIRFVEMDGL